MPWGPWAGSARETLAAAAMVIYGAGDVAEVGVG